MFSLISYSGVTNMLYITLLILSCGLVVSAVTEFGNRTRAIWQKDGLDPVQFVLAGGLALFYLIVGCKFTQVAYMALIYNILSEFTYYQRQDPEFQYNFDVRW